MIYKVGFSRILKHLSEYARKGYALETEYNHRDHARAWHNIHKEVEAIIPEVEDLLTHTDD